MWLTICVTGALLEQWHGRGVRQYSEMDQTELLWTSSISAATTPCEARIPLPGRRVTQKNALRLKIPRDYAPVKLDRGHDRAQNVQHAPPILAPGKVPRLQESVNR